MYILCVPPVSAVSVLSESTIHVVCQYRIHSMRSTEPVNRMKRQEYILVLIHHTSCHIQEHTQHLATMSGTLSTHI